MKSSGPRATDGWYKEQAKTTAAKLTTVNCMRNFMRTFGQALTNFFMQYESITGLEMGGRCRLSSSPYREQKKRKKYHL